MDFDHLGFVVRDVKTDSKIFEKNFNLKILTPIIFDKIQKLAVKPIKSDCQLEIF